MGSGNSKLSSSGSVLFFLHYLYVQEHNLIGIGCTGLDTIVSPSGKTPCPVPNPSVSTQPKLRCLHPQDPQSSHTLLRSTSPVHQLESHWHLTKGILDFIGVFTLSSNTFQSLLCCYSSTLKYASHHFKSYSPGVSFPLSSVLGILREKGKEHKVRASVQLLLKFSQPVVLSAKWRLNRNIDRGIKISEKDKVSIQKFFIH